MSADNARIPKSSSWPKTKTVVKKWLNLKNAEFHSDCSKESFGGGGLQERRKSCSDKDGSLLMRRDFSGGWVMESSENLKPPPYGSQPPPSSSHPSKDLRMFVGTWNVGGRAPHEGLDLSDWLINSPSSPAHIYVLGFQEIVPLNAGNVLGAEDKGPAYKWLSLIRRALNPSSERSHSFGQNYGNGTEVNYEPPKSRLSFSDLLAMEDRFSMTSEPDDDTEPSSSNPESSSEEDMSEFLVPGRSLLGYRLAASKQMVGIFLCVWVHEDLIPSVTSLKVSCVGRGIMGYMGNKGSISISMTLQRNTTLCFVCTHLASGEKNGDEVRRNSNVVEILKRTTFPQPHRFSRPAALSPETILEHDKIIWLGDLNYRLTGSCGDMQRLLKNNDWRSLLEKDQLRIEQRAGRVFAGWEEGHICFPPTYKYLADSDTYAMNSPRSREKKRTPAWCDRILWRGKGMKQMWYIRGESRFSDHRPVYSLFSVQVDDRTAGTAIAPASPDHISRTVCGGSYRHSRTPKPAVTAPTVVHDMATRGMVEDEEMLLLARTQSCLHASRF